jgi:hypothetical protein
VPQTASRQGRVLLSVRARAISSPSDLPAAPTSIVLPTEAAPPPAVYQRVGTRHSAMQHVHGFESEVHASGLHNPKKSCRMRPWTEGVHMGCVLCDQVVEAGVAKAKLPLWKLILLGFVAGFYIGFGALLMLNIGVSCPGLASVSFCNTLVALPTLAVRCTSPQQASSLSHDEAAACLRTPARGPMPATLFFTRICAAYSVLPPLQDERTHLDLLTVAS